jgi:hypothetical protein
VSGSFTPAGTGHPYPAHHTVAKLGAEPTEQIRCQQPYLGRPGGGIGRHHEFALVKGLRFGMRGKFRSDDPSPLAEHRAHRRPLPPASARKQSADSRGQPLGIIASRSSTGFNVGAKGIYASSSRIIGKS